MRVCLAVVLVSVATTGCANFLSDRGEPDPDGEVETHTLGADVVEVRDAWVLEITPNTPYGSDPLLVFDEEFSEEDNGPEGRAAALLYFDLVGLDAAQIEPGAEVLEATLFLTVSDDGDAGQLCEMLVPWGEETTWETLGASPGYEPTADFDTTLIAAVFPTVEGEVLALDVTASVAAWVAGERENLGWIIVPSGSNGSEIFSTEAPGETQRPELVVKTRR